MGGRPGQHQGHGIFNSIIFGGARRRTSQRRSQRRSQRQQQRRRRN